MLIKAQDDKQTSLQALEQLLTLPHLSDDQRRKIEHEQRILKAGIKGEQESVYLINFDFENKKNWTVIHDLRLEHKGRVAQIDHLLINRTLEFFVLETKNFSTGIKINDQGEFLRWDAYKKTYEGIPSPIEQNSRHIKVLQDALTDIKLPKRAGITLKPQFTSYILISSSARIERSQRVDTSQIIKADTLHTKLMQHLGVDAAIPKNPFKLIGETWDILNTVPRIIHPEALQDIAEQLASLHKPITIDYSAKFGIKPTEKVLNECNKLTQTGDHKHTCPHCGSTALNIQHGYNYYFKCLNCKGNTKIEHPCTNENCKAKLRKQGNQFFKSLFKIFSATALKRLGEQSSNLY